VPGDSRACGAARPAPGETSLDTSGEAGTVPGMDAARKVTVELPERLLREALESTGEGITATIRKGLELVASGKVCNDLRRLRGKVPLSIDLKELREDRR
jgi:hypothetical protein